MYPYPIVIIFWSCWGFVFKWLSAWSLDDKNSVGPAAETEPKK